MTMTMILIAVFVYIDFVNVVDDTDDQKSICSLMFFCNRGYSGM